MANLFLIVVVSLQVGITSESITMSDVKESRNVDHPLATCPRGKFCSVWHYCHEGECKLGELPPNDILRDDGKHTSVLDHTCVTYNANENLLEAGTCLYNFIHFPYYRLPKDILKLNEDMCGEHFNRTGTLCGKCADDTSPLVYSYEMTCVPCPNGKSNWWKFMLAAFLPLTVFYFVALFFKINITSSPLFGFVYVIQTLSHPELVKLSFVAFQSKPSFLLGLRFFAALCGIWNLDFFRSTYNICLGTDTLQTMALELAIGVYPLLLMILSYLLIILYDRNIRLFVFMLKPFQIISNFFRTNWDVRTSTIDVYATFFLLSNVKFLSISYDLLTPVKVYQLNSTGSLTHSWRLYYDADVTYFGKEHLPYAILAIASFLLFVLFPILLLVLYPFRWFQKLLNFFPFRWYILHTFVDSFQGCYKDGMAEGTRDYRWFASLFFLLRLIFYFIGTMISSSVFFVVCSLAAVLLLVLLLILQPFKENVRHYSTINASFLLIMLMFTVDVLAIFMSRMWSPQLLPISLITLIAIGVILLLYTPAITLHYIGICRCILVPIRKFQAWKRGYNML